MNVLNKISQTTAEMANATQNVVGLGKQDERNAAKSSQAGQRQYATQQPQDYSQVHPAAVGLDKQDEHEFAQSPHPSRSRYATQQPYDYSRVNPAAVGPANLSGGHAASMSDAQSRQTSEPVDSTTSTRESSTSTQDSGIAITDFHDPLKPRSEQPSISTPPLPPSQPQTQQPSVSQRPSEVPPIQIPESSVEQVRPAPPPPPGPHKTDTYLKTLPDGVHVYIGRDTRHQIRLPDDWHSLPPEESSRISLQLIERRIDEEMPREIINMSERCEGQQIEKVVVE